MTALNTSTSIHRLVVRGQLELKGSFHIGSGSASQFSDMALRRDAQGQVYIPGTSLVGLLRSAAEDLAPYVTGSIQDPQSRSQPGLTSDLFGWSPEKGTSGGGQAARLTMLNALPKKALPNILEIRDHVGMDRKTGAARKGLFYNREVAPANSCFKFEFHVQEPTAEEVRLLKAVLDLWATSGVRLGGRTTSGLGLAQLQNIQWFALDFSQDNLLLAYLLPPAEAPDGEEYLPVDECKPEQIEAMLGPAPEPVSPVVAEERYLPQRVVIELELETLDPLLVVGYTPKLDASGERPTDAAFVTRLKLKDNGKAINEIFLPGSGFKGVLRSRAEKIARTLDYYTGYAKQEDAWNDAGAQAQYARRISACAVTHALAPKEEPTRLHACFGGVRMDNTEGQEEPGLYKQSCLTCRLFGNTALRGRLVVDDGLLLTEGKTKLFDHVAIDRFSGGAADAKKFDDRPLLPGERFSIRLELQRPEPWMLGYLALLLKDLDDGDLYLGHATHRGYGRVRAWVKGAQALALPGSKLSSALIEAGYQRPQSLPGPFWQVDLGLDALFTPQGLAAPQELGVPESEALKLITACHTEFITKVKEIQQIPNLGEIKEVRP